MPKVRTNRITYPDGWELIEPTLLELDAKMREAQNDPNDGKRKCEALWPIFKISHQRSRYVFDLYHKRNAISKELYEFCLDQGYADRYLIAKWKKFDECGSFALQWQPFISTPNTDEYDKIFQSIKASMDEIVEQLSWTDEDSD
ncbi:Protein BUD31-1-like protein [Morus notabilis]|uniref:Protein BUD31-1-like protein n=1 Tax=Morus notabilis TaxID=981085 RepID=W9R0U5_9ROSA|nr:Protein BUD31-1-like protein [Morus notabilis]